MTTTRQILRVLGTLLGAALVVLLGLAAPSAAQTYGGAGQAVVSSGTGQPGSTVEVSGSGFRPNSDVTITFESTPVRLATVRADAAGAVAARVTIPRSATQGEHTIRLAGVDPSGQPRVLSSAFVVSGSLPTTGTNSTWRIVVLAVVCIAAGAVLLGVVRRRQRAG